MIDKVGIVPESSSTSLQYWCLLIVAERSVQACGQAPLLYVDVSSLPVLVAYWRHAPPLWMDDWKYVVTVWDGHNLRDNTTFEGPFRVEAVLSFEFSTNSVPGVYHFEVTVLSNSCKAGVCHVSRSPDIVVGACFVWLLLATCFYSHDVPCILFLLTLEFRILTVKINLDKL